MEHQPVYRPHAAMDAKSRVASNLRRLRTERGLTQEDLSERSNVHQTYLSGVESAKRNPTVEVLERIATALRVDISELFRKP